jgi:hypothetical protein
VVRVLARRGCDVAPLDVRRTDDRLRLLAYVWPDQHERLEHLRRAIECVAASPVRVDRQEAGAWLAQHLPADAPRHVGGAVRVVYHSIVLQYLSPPGVTPRSPAFRGTEPPRLRPRRSRGFAWSPPSIDATPS